MPRARRLLAGVPIAAATLLALSACKVVSLEENRAIRERQSGAFDAERYVEREWVTRVMPTLERSAVPIAQLLAATSIDLDAAGTEYGRRAGEGSPWAFVTKGDGVVRAINDRSQEGTIELLVSNGTGETQVLVQTGPVIVDNSLRDALPFVTFNDFSGQLAFADVGRSLTRQALAGTLKTVRTLAVRDKVTFLGTLNLSGNEETPRLIPVRLAKTGRES